jgi:hypothetical protein
MDFRNIYAQGFARVASCTVPVALADAATNAERIIQQVKACHDDGVAVALFPELSLSGYAIDDLLLQDVLLEAVDEAVVTIAEATAKLLPLVVVGAPVRHGNRLYNCGIVLHRGEILGVSPKSFLPNYREFYEKRHFASGAGHQGEFLVRPHWPGADADGEIPFGPDLLFAADDHPDLAVHVEVCEDMWVPVPPSARSRPGRRDRAAQPLGLPHHGGTRRGPTPAGAFGERPLPRRLPLRRRERRGVDHRPVVGRHDDGLRDGRPARRVRALPRRAAPHRRRRRPRPAAPGAHPPGQRSTTTAEAYAADRGRVPRRRVRAAPAER